MDAAVVTNLKEKSRRSPAATKKKNHKNSHLRCLVGKLREAHPKTNLAYYYTKTIRFTEYLSLNMDLLRKTNKGCISNFLEVFGQT